MKISKVSFGDALAKLVSPKPGHFDHFSIGWNVQFGRWIDVEIDGHQLPIVGATQEFKVKNNFRLNRVVTLQTQEPVCGY